MADEMFRIEMNFTVTTGSLEAATELHDRILAAAEGAGANYEGGIVELVPENERIAPAA